MAARQEGEVCTPTAVDCVLTCAEQLVFMIIELIIGIAIGFIPCEWLSICFNQWYRLSMTMLDVDNFAHIGGLLMGLLVAMVLYPIISPSARHRTIVIALRLIAAPIAIVLFVVLVRNFYTSDPYAGECPTTFSIDVHLTMFST